MNKIWIVVGTRPEVIKLAPLVHELRKDSTLKVQLISTGQHREILLQALESFGLMPDIELHSMTNHQTLAESMSRILNSLHKSLTEDRPDLMIVQGDTTTTMAGALAAFYARIPIAHVEAGLRTFRMDDPFPEEMHRAATAVMADFHFAPTEEAKQNLLNGGTPEERILVTGNTGIDALFLAERLLREGEKRPQISWQSGEDCTKILCTFHRRESLGGKILNLLRDLRRISTEKKCEIILPVHPNPTVLQAVREILQDTPVRLVEATDYPTFIHLLGSCNLVITDSGGVQEEAATLGKFLIIARECTERPEAVEAGALLVEPQPERLYQTLIKYWPTGFKFSSKRAHPFGKGEASRLIHQFLRDKAFS
jgi:UDP-N-acetylglucosamine 2-epimerase (non-hydrolysing)